MAQRSARRLWSLGQGWVPVWQPAWGWRPKREVRWGPGLAPLWTVPLARELGPAFELGWG